MAKLEKPKHGCFSSFLRVFLCAGNATSPPVHPSDHVTESDEKKQKVHHSNKETLVGDDGATPGVVARLMGLDSLPKSKWVVNGTTPDCVPRSRSVNFVDYMLEFDLGHAEHRRVKTSASFREVPGLVQRPKKCDNFVLYMDGKVCEDQEDGPELKKLEMGLGDLRLRKRHRSRNKEIVSAKKERNQGKNKKISKLKNEPRRVPSSKHSSKGLNLGESSRSSKSCSYRCSGATSSSRLKVNSLQNKQKKGFVEPKMRKNVRTQQPLLTIESEYGLENHSPVSVLDSNVYAFLCGTDSLDGTSPIASKSKWESSSLLSLSDGVEERASTNNGYACTDANKEAEYYSELMLKLSTLTKQDIGELDCTLKRICGSESFEEICLVFEHKIFDLLLYEVVNEVLQVYC
ncbi:uncharacterized protein LOC113851596 [Abrus precatorius]|uniref:Uncharacterized protein LOC113851596 n=1 Tax=Abrus precatorius TaxID=3816 RepID=A0A8B8K3I0_ABRPR|nr:uncharacterized protein LOC113851596 [Abrus precatorius]